MQIMMERWKRKTGADVVSVPARGGGDIVTGLLTGTAPVASDCSSRDSLRPKS
jgi:tripartite-type tricarboxylate transporter receptor subunit TctC